MMHVQTFKLGVVIQIRLVNWNIGSALISQIV